MKRGKIEVNLDSVWSEYAFDEIPFSEIVHLGQRSLLRRDIFVVSWLLGRYCNYRCSYCWPYARTDRKDHRPLEVLIQSLDEIKRQSRARGFYSFHFSFSGGEPTFHPQYLDLLSHYAADTENCNYQSVHMTSNISQNLKWFENYARVTSGLHRVSVTASFHKEYTRREIFVEKLKFLQGEDIQVTINMVMVPTRFDELWQDALHFHEQGLNVTLKPQSNKSAEAVVEGYSAQQLKMLQLGMPQRGYTEEHLASLKKASQRPLAPWSVTEDRKAGDSNARMQVALLDKEGRTHYMDQAERLNAFKFNSFKGWECSSGYRSLIVREPGGVVKRSYSCHDKPLGTLDGGFQLFDSLRACKTSSCVSSADSKIPKRKAGESQALWQHYGPPKVEK